MHIIWEERLVPHLWIDRLSVLVLILNDRQPGVHIHGEPPVCIRNQLFKILVVLIFDFILVFDFEWRILGHSLRKVGYKISLSIGCASITDKEHIAALIIFWRRSKAFNKLLCVDILELASVEGWLIVWNVHLIEVWAVKALTIICSGLKSPPFCTLGEITDSLWNLIASWFRATITKLLWRRSNNLNALRVPRCLIAHLMVRLLQVYIRCIYGRDQLILLCHVLRSNTTEIMPVWSDIPRFISHQIIRVIVSVAFLYRRLLTPLQSVAFLWFSLSAEVLKMGLLYRLEVFLAFHELQVAI